jgi:hypothetical protein
MAHIPAILYVSAASEVGPVLAGIIKRPGRGDPRAWVVAWCLLLVGANGAGLYLGSHGINTHPLVYGIIPFQGATILWALSLWQTRQLARLTMRAAIPPFLVAWGLLLLVEDLYNFSAIAEPVYSLLALAAALYTLVSRSGEATESLLGADWFWVCAGLALHFGALVFLTPFSAALVRTNPEIVVRAYQVRAAINILAFAIITIGIVCPRPIPLSGRSFSPASSV